MVPSCHSLPARRRRGTMPAVAIFHRIAWLAIAVVSLAWQATARAVNLTVTPDRLDVANATQRWSCLRGSDGRIGILTSVRDDATDAPPWRPLFDGLRPLVEGADFDIDHSYATLLSALKDRYESELANMLFDGRN